MSVSAVATPEVDCPPWPKSASAPIAGRSVRVRGTVQGVGFRPFVYGLAQKHGLFGTVRNTGGQVEIEIEGASAALDHFLTDLTGLAPPLAAIQRIDVTPQPVRGYQRFHIVASELLGSQQPVPPDIATCNDCLRELFDAHDRRYHYPFINCTNCGPRFTIIDALPYDRARTSMREFEMCPECRREYEDPTNRRFHAQPIACPECGPRVWLHGMNDRAGDVFAVAAQLLADGHILAVKGLGGFQLACAAGNADAVATLRARKRRFGKPFALMVPDSDWAKRLAHLSPAESERLESRERPIVLLERIADAPIAPEVADGLSTIGIMLPYTPLHHLLLRAVDGPLVMTSGNLSEEPIAIHNEEALTRLANVADDFLLHDRPIRARYDDSVVRVVAERTVPIRRARGFAPAPIVLPFASARDIVAFGAQQKNTFCLVQGSNAYLSQHLGDLDNLLTGDHLRDTLALYLKLFRAEPGLVAHDAHPDYLSTRLAREYAGSDLPCVPVQHHHAHVVSCMAEHHLTGPVIGVAYDGTGLGDDGAIWGGEVLTATWTQYERRAHLRYVPLLGGEAAVREPLRMLASHLWAAGEREASRAHMLERITVEQRKVWRHQFESGLNAPLTSSCGRLFDAAAVLLGLCETARYEGEPAMLLESVADPGASGSYPFEITYENEHQIVNVGPTFHAMLQALACTDPVPEIAMRFHNTVARFTAVTCALVRGMTGITQVCLSGGCFQNALLVLRTRAELEQRGFQVFTQALVPPNDGGIALGQAVVAAARAASAMPR